MAPSLLLQSISPGFLSCLAYRLLCTSVLAPGLKHRHCCYFYILRGHFFTSSATRPVLCRTSVDGECRGAQAHHPVAPSYRTCLTQNHLVTLILHQFFGIKKPPRLLLPEAVAPIVLQLHEKWVLQCHLPDLLQTQRHQPNSDPCQTCCN